MFFIIFLFLVFTSYIIAADMDSKYKIGYGVVTTLILTLIVLSKVLAV